MFELLCFLLSLSAAGNIALAFLFTRRPKPEKSQTEESYDVKCLLRDLASGPALVKIEYLDRADVLLRSPRHT